MIRRVTQQDRGPQVVRHPSYLGVWLAMIGAALWLGSWQTALLTAAVMTPVYVARIRAEEVALLTVLGDDYRDYCVGRARLLPLVW